MDLKQTKLNANIHLPEDLLLFFIIPLTRKINIAHIITNLNNGNPAKP